MASFSLFRFILLALVFSVALNNQNVPQAYAQEKICQEQLYRSGCTLSDCWEKCFNKHHDAGHSCVANVAGTDYACYCFFNC
ncbi:hypothetical protein L3X38_038405 [Prunus dulcis]|uniref:Uncharacterized protein n=1 Tax=Prunus dulcis TaxID=3755 RepID=A0AAD4YQG2_PRUDU|nr:hypothetical protein L3X38_038405 [Prunus dulcis]